MSDLNKDSNNDSIKTLQLNTRWILSYLVYGLGFA